MEQKEGRHQRLEMVQFGVERLKDIRTLLTTWQRVLAELSGKKLKPSLVMRTYRQVGIEVEDRRPGMEVLLTFLAPPEVLSRYKADLRNQGLACRVLPGPTH